MVPSTADSGVGWGGADVVVDDAVEGGGGDDPSSFDDEDSGPAVPRDHSARRQLHLVIGTMQSIGC